jgi:hypothetical protein
MPILFIGQLNKYQNAALLAPVVTLPNDVDRNKQCATITKIYNEAQPIILHTHHLVSFTIVTLLNIMSATSRIEYSEKYADETHEYRYVAIRLKS